MYTHARKVFYYFDFTYELASIDSTDDVIVIVDGFFIHL